MAIVLRVIILELIKVCTRWADGWKGGDADLCKVCREVRADARRRAVPLYGRFTSAVNPMNRVENLPGML